MFYTKLVKYSITDVAELLTITKWAESMNHLKRRGLLPQKLEHVWLYMRR